MAVVQTLIGNVKGPAGATGATGATGPQGQAATIAVGSVTSAAYGTPASVTNSGTSGAAVFDFVIPQGRPGQATTTMGGLTLDTITTSTDEFPSPAVDDTGAIAFGKIRKFFADTLSALASKIDTSKIANNLTTTDTSYVLSAAQGKALNDSLASSIALSKTTITEISVANTVRAFHVQFGNSGLSAILFTVSSQTVVNLSPYISYVYSLFGQGTTTNNFKNVSITQTDSAHISVDPNYGQTTKYSAWCLAFGVTTTS